MTTLAASHDVREANRSSMLAGVLAAPGTIRVEHVQTPEPGPGQVRVRIESCGVCGSNVPVWEGREWFRYPLAPGAPGHEACGRVDAVGEGVTGLQPGQRVGMLSYHAFAEYDIAEADHTVRLPAELDGAPFPAEALGCAINVYRRSAVRPGDTVALIGFGFLGSLVAQQAVRAGARVVAIGRRPSALALAREMGIEHTLVLDDPKRVVGSIAELTGGRLCDVVIEAAGSQGSLDLGAELARERGRLVIAGFHQDGPRQVNMFLWNWRGLDVINAHERDPATYVEGMRTAVSEVVAGRLDPSPLYTHTFPLDRLGEALEAARVRPEGLMKAIVTMQAEECR